MTKWKFRSCPRCSGDIYVEKDDDESYERCLQCGYVNFTGKSAYSYRSALLSEQLHSDKLQRHAVSSTR